MSRLIVPRLLATGSVITAVTGFRVGVSCVELLVERTPPLVRLAVEATGGCVGAGWAEAAFRDSLVALVRDSAVDSWRELRRGVDEFDALIRSDAGGVERGSRRPYRVKQ